MAAGAPPDPHRRRLPAPPRPRKPGPGQPWSDDQTLALIDAYEARCSAVKRGHLRAPQWEEVAAAVAARCGGAAPSKTGTQCRHKVEKLRQRYRSERSRRPSSWPFFARMDRAVSSVAGAAVDGGDDDEEEWGGGGGGSNTRSLNGILRDTNWGFPKAPRRNSRPKEPIFDASDYYDDDRRRGPISELAAVVRRFGDGMVRMEKRRMQMMRELERDWMEMEAKRVEMFVESQQCLVEMIAGAFASGKKAKKSPDNV